VYFCYANFINKDKFNLYIIGGARVFFFNMGSAEIIKVGTKVDVFHFMRTPEEIYFLAPNKCAGQQHPSVGITHGWVAAQLIEDYDPCKFDQRRLDTHARVMFLSNNWYNSRGKKIDNLAPRINNYRVSWPSCLRITQKGNSQYPPPMITFVTLRWGGEKPVDPVTEGLGGWGNIGATPSDNYINGFFDEAFYCMGPQFETIAIWFQNSEELEKALILPGLIKNMAKGQNIAGMYFCWPISYEDGHEYPGYVERKRLLALMERMEASGIPTRFPHNSHQYRMFVSKEWMAQTCLIPGLNVPLTTKLSRQIVEDRGPLEAGKIAMSALSHLNRARCTMFNFNDLAPERTKYDIDVGVCKLGWSWEAMDVLKWTNLQQLRGGINDLINQPDNWMDFVLVQEFIDFDVEMRHYVLSPTGHELTPPIRKVVYTKYKRVNSGRFCEFDRFDRSDCVKRFFANDEAAVIDAEEKSKVLITRWLKWLRAESAELPVFLRFDIMAKRIGPGRAKVTTGELTELGGCFLGWPEGPREVFRAMINSCFGSKDGRWADPFGFLHRPYGNIEAPSSHPGYASYDEYPMKAPEPSSLSAVPTPPPALRPIPRKEDACNTNGILTDKKGKKENEDYARNEEDKEKEKESRTESTTSTDKVEC